MDRFVYSYLQCGAIDGNRRKECRGGAISSDSNQFTYREDIDGLRALAVLSVVLFHLKFNWISGGFVGVDVFFVISGFLITGNICRQLQKKEFSLRSFYIRRFRRLFPALAVTIFGSVIVGSFVMSPVDLNSFALSAVSSLISLSNFQFWLEAGYFDMVGDLKPLLHTWSLGVEEQFYLVWPLMVIGLAKFAKTRAAMLTGLLVIGFISLLAAEKGLGVDSSMVFFLTPFRICEFVIGATISQLRKPLFVNRVFVEVLGIGGLALVTLPMFLFSETTVFPGVSAMAPCIGAGLVIYCGPRSLISAALSGRVFVAIGKASYSLYLVHWPIISFFAYWKLQPLLNFEKAVIGALTLVAAYVLNTKVEVPFRIGGVSLDQVGKTRRSSLFPIACLSVLTLAVCGYIRLTNGWGERIQGNFHELGENVADYHRLHFGGGGYSLDGTIGKVSSDFDLLLFGDSHALAYTGGFDEILKTENRTARTIFRHGCFFSNIVSRHFGTINDKSCEVQAEKILRLLGDTKKPVVFAQNWNSYKNSLVYPTGEKLEFATDLEYVAFLWKMVVELHKYLGNQRPFVIIGQLPRSTNSAGVVTCLIRPQWFKSPCLEGIHYPHELGDPLLVNSYFSRHAAEDPSLLFIDPSEAFCWQGTCHLMQGEEIWYSDVSHLSKTGSRRATNKMWPNIKPLLEKKS